MKIMTDLEIIIRGVKSYKAGPGWIELKLGDGAICKFEGLPEAKAQSLRCAAQAALVPSKRS